MRIMGTDEPWPVVKIEFTTLELKVIEDALEFAEGEVNKWDAKTIADIRADIGKVLRHVEKGRSSGVPRFSILRRK